MDPVGVIALLLVGLQRPVDGLLRVDGLLDALSTDLRQPQLERLRFRGGNGLDDSEKLLGVGYISIIALPIFGRSHFQLLTICQQLICPFFFKTLLQFCPIVTCTALIRLISQHSYHINDRKVPFFLFFIPCGANALVFEQLDLIVLCHSNHLILS